MRRSNGPSAARNRCRCHPPTRNFSPSSGTLTSTSGMNVRMQRLAVLLGLAAVALALGARAQLTIDITTSGGRQIPIAIAPMAGGSAQPQSLSDVVAADLARTGLFRLVNAAGVSPLP